MGGKQRRDTTSPSRARGGPKGPARANGWPLWAGAFLAALEAGRGTVADACSAVGIHRQTAYDLKHANEAFRLAWEEVQERVTDELEREAVLRATEGREEVVGVSKSGIPITTTRRSDRLLEFLLKGRRRVVYGESKGSVQVNVTPESLREMSDADLDRLIAKLAG